MPALAYDPIDVDHFSHDRARYLCEWSKRYPENPVPLPSCDGHALGDISEMEAWWQWMFNTKMNAAVAIRNSFLADWDRDRRPALDRQRRVVRERAAEKQKAEDAKLHAEVVAEREAFAVSAPTLSSERLCIKSHDYGYFAPAATELRRRVALTDNEWALISARKIGVGMSELALLCSWGSAPVNRTVTAAGIHKQYVYPDGALVYVENGRVTGFQDRE